MLSYVDGLTKIWPNVKHTTDVSTAYLQNMLSCMSTSAIFFFCGTTVQMGPRPPHCWIFLDHTHLQTQTHPEYVIIIAFPRRQLLCERTSLLRYKTHCLSCYSINSSRNISVHIVTRLRAALLSNGDWIARSDGKFFTSPNGLHPVWNPPHSASLQWVL